MLYKIQCGNEIKGLLPENNVYCAIKLEDVINSGVDCVFTDGHAIGKFTKFYSKEELPNVDSYVKYDDVMAIDWQNTEEDSDRKRRKSAELLIKEKLTPEFIFMFGVYNDNARRKVINFRVEESKIVVSPKDYF